MEEKSYLMITGLLAAIAVAGSLANLVVIIAVARNRKMWNRQSLLIVNVACADLIVATIGIIFPLVSSIYHRWMFSELACYIYAFTMDFVAIASATTLAFLALDRALKVRQSNLYTKIPRTQLIITCIWIYSFLVTCPPFFGWGKFALEGPGISCSVDWQSSTLNSLSYITFLFTMGFFIQLFVMLWSHKNLYFVVRQVSIKGRRRSSAVDRAERRVGCMLTTMVICYLVAWLPYSVVALLKVLSTILDLSALNLNGFYGYLPSLLAKSSIAYNPIIYALFNTQFRRKRPSNRYPSKQENAGDSKKAKRDTHQVTNFSIPQPTSCSNGISAQSALTPRNPSVFSVLIETDAVVESDISRIMLENP